MKLFTCKVLESSIEQVIDGLPGWSHQGSSTEREVTYYPFKVWQREIFFRAQNRREAIKQIQRIPFSSPTSINEWSPESPVLIVRRKAALARELCMKETFKGDFSRMDFYKKIYQISN